MIIILKKDPEPRQLENLKAWLTSRQLTIHESKGESHTILGLVGDTTAVDIESWEEDVERGHVTIHAVIYVGRPSHKAMVIGHAGQNIKQAGTAARKEIAELLERKVHLELWVKVKENWIDDAAFLHALGLGAR